jgi:type III pantothenate kinase
MSSLLIDLGNTRCKLALGSGGTLSAVAAFGVAERGPIEGYLEGQASADMPSYISSVAAGDVTAQVAGLVERRTGCPPAVLRSTDPVPLVRNGYRRPEQLGVDRLVAMVAARARADGPLCVIDAGTAVTIDFVAADGQHLGGFILPGQQLARDCLLARTSIPREPAVDAEAVIGRDTATAVALGAQQGVVSIVHFFTEGPGSLFPNQRAGVVVGGGGAAALRRLLPRDCITLPDLVLHGLAVIAAGGSGGCAGSSLS